MARNFFSPIAHTEQPVNCAHDLFVLRAYLRIACQILQQWLHSSSFSATMHALLNAQEWNNVIELFIAEMEAQRAWVLETIWRRIKAELREEKRPPKNEQNIRALAKPEKKWKLDDFDMDLRALEHCKLSHNDADGTSKNGYLLMRGCMELVKKKLTNAIELIDRYFEMATMEKTVKNENFARFTSWFGVGAKKGVPQWKDARMEMMLWNLAKTMQIQLQIGTDEGGR